MGLVKKYPDCVPEFMIEYVYKMVIGHGSVIKNISIDTKLPNLGITGGSPDIEPLHSFDIDYISFQEFINGVSKRTGN